MTTTMISDETSLFDDKALFEGEMVQPSREFLLIVVEGIDELFKIFCPIVEKMDELEIGNLEEYIKNWVLGSDNGLNFANGLEIFDEHTNKKFTDILVNYENPLKVRCIDGKHYYCIAIRSR